MVPPPWRAPSKEEAGRFSTGAASTVVIASRLPAVTRRAASEVDTLPASCVGTPP
jgi:hypothetical protein